MSKKSKNISVAPALSDSEAEKKAKRKKRVIIAVSVVVIAAIAVAIILPLALHREADETYDPYEGGVFIDVEAVNRYGDIVEPQETVKVEKDADLKVAEVYVKAGDTVKKGDKLFSYDTAQTKLDLALAKLEYDGMSNEITGYDNQIAELTSQRGQANEDQKLDYTLQIQQAELSKSRAKMNLQSKQLDIDRLEQKVDTAEVVSPISGIIKTVSSEGSDSSDMDSTAFITILTTEGCRIKGSVDEANIAGLYENMKVKVYARADESKSWNGTVTKIDTESPGNSSNGSNDMYGGYGDTQERATKYSFYVSLDDAGDILLGQHVYIEPIEEFEDDDTGNTVDDTAEDADVAPDKAE